MPPDDPEVYTIPQLADRIGVSGQSVRNWIRSGRIEPPREIPATGEKIYPAEDADRIERDYMVRAANGGTRGPGSAQRRERAREWLREHEGGLDSDDEEEAIESAVSRLPSDSPAAIVDKEVRRWLILEDHLLPVIPLVVAVANQLDGPPVWLMVVAPPSSGKSEVIRGLNALDGVYHISTITSRTFASGMIAPGGSDRRPSLLDRMAERGQWLLTLKDFGTIQSLQHETRNEIYGQFREIYDGQFSATWGTGVELDWDGKLGMLVGATPAVDRQYKWAAELGERFVQFRPLASDPEEVSRRAVQAAEDEEEKNAAIKAAYRDSFQQASGTISSRRASNEVLGEQREELVAALARFTALARAPVHRQRGGNRFQALEPEGPARLAKVFAQLYKASLVCFDDSDRLARRFVSRVAIDCIPGRRGRLLRGLAEQPHGVTAKTMAKRLKCDKGTARTELHDLVAIGLAEVEEPAQTTIYIASRRLYDAAQAVYSDAKNGEEALAILCDRGTKHTPERERKTYDGDEGQS